MEVTLAPSIATPGGWNVGLYLRWRAASPLLVPHKVFVHVGAPPSRIAAQDDSVPAIGARPTPGWGEGEEIIDFHRVRIPPADSTESYAVFVGLYDEASGVRLARIDRTSRTPPDWAIIGTLVFGGARYVFYPEPEEGI